MKIVLLLLLKVLLVADSYPSFTDSELNKIEKQNSRISKNRIVDYQRKVSLFKTYTKKKQLIVVNHYLNQLLPQYDDVIQKQEDYWATPKEFLTTGYGDCEDYVIIKYFTLLKLGFNEGKLFLTIVSENSTTLHMVLSYFEHENKAPLILDNLSFRVLDLEKRTDLKARTFINSTGVYKLEDGYRLKKIAHHSKEYNELMKRVNQNR